MSVTVVLHVSHVKVPKTSSGRTSLVLVTVPEMLMSVPIFAVRSSRMDETSGRPWKAIENSRVRRPPVVEDEVEPEEVGER